MGSRNRPATTPPATTPPANAPRASPTDSVAPCGRSVIPRAPLARDETLASARPAERGLPNRGTRSRGARSPRAQEPNGPVP